MTKKILEDLYLKLADNDFIEKFEHVNKRKYPQIHMINGLPLNLDVEAKRICVTLSGGADSTILTIMLCELIKKLQCKTKIHAITMVRFWETKPWLARDAEKIFLHLQEKYPDILETQHWGFVPPHLEPVPIVNLGVTWLVSEYPKHAKVDAYVVNEFEDYIMSRHNIEWSYSGVTMNPPLDTPDQPKFRNIEFTQNEIGRVVSAVHISPFALLQKNYTLAQYKNYDVEYLLPMTRSCEADIETVGIKYKTNEETPPTCGFCFFCQERQWGLDNASVYYKEQL